MQIPSISSPALHPLATCLEQGVGTGRDGRDGRNAKRLFRAVARYAIAFLDEHGAPSLHEDTASAPSRASRDLGLRPGNSGRTTATPSASAPTGASGSSAAPTNPDPTNGSRGGSVVAWLRSSRGSQPPLAGLLSFPAGRSDPRAAGNEGGG